MLTLWAIIRICFFNSVLKFKSLLCVCRYCGLLFSVAAQLLMFWKNKDYNVSSHFIGHHNPFTLTIVMSSHPLSQEAGRTWWDRQDIRLAGEKPKLVFLVSGDLNPDLFKIDF